MNIHCMDCDGNKAPPKSGSCRRCGGKGFYDTPPAPTQEEREFFVAMASGRAALSLGRWESRRLDKFVRWGWIDQRDGRNLLTDRGRTALSEFRGGA